MQNESSQVRQGPAQSLVWILLCLISSCVACRRAHDARTIATDAARDRRSAAAELDALTRRVDELATRVEALERR